MVKKFFTNESFATLIEEIKSHVKKAVSSKADTEHSHDDLYYTETEVNTLISNLTSGTTPVAKAETAEQATKATQDTNGNVIIDTYETKSDATAKFNEAKSYADTAATNVKNDLLNGAGDAYDTLKELGDLIDENQDAIEALETIATNKADKDHVHDVYETKEDAQLKYDTITEAKADWSQNDKNAIDYVKNRTHWAEKATELIYQADSITGEKQDWINGYYTDIPVPDTENLYGEQYIVTVDGISYTCEPHPIYGEYCLGDSRLAGYLDENGTINTEHPEDVPFLIQTYYYCEESLDFGITEWWEWGVTFNTPGSHTLKIEQVDPNQSTYHPLDERFIPEEIARKSYVDETKANVIHTHNYYGYCSTFDTSSEKIVEMEGDFELYKGAMIAVKFLWRNSASNPKLNVNGTGAKPIYAYKNTPISTTSDPNKSYLSWENGAVVIFIYDGNNWIRNYWNNSVTNGLLGQGYSSCDTLQSTIEKTASVANYEICAGGIISIKFRYAVPANATLNINSKGAKPIYYRGVAITDDIIKAGDTATFIYSTNYYLISVDRWQEDIKGKADKEYVDSTFARKSDIKDVDLSGYETKEDAQLKYNIITNAKADWNLNDETAIDYIKNRPFYESEGKSLYVFEPIATYDTTLNGDQIPCLQPIVEGEKYILTRDGIEFECVATHNDYRNPCLVVEEEYITVVYYPEWQCCDVSPGDLSEHTVSVQTCGASIKQLDEKFIPDTIARQEYVDATFARKEDINNEPKTEIFLKDIENGFIYKLQIKGGTLVTSCETSSIIVSKLPDKLSYNENEEFDPSGMIVTAVCADGSTKEITDYTYSVNGNIVTITYTDDINTLTTTLEINIATMADILQDFTYTENADGTYTLTGWKQTLNGQPSTEMIIPDNEKIVL